MRVLVTGVNGQLGHDVMLSLQAHGHEAIGSGSTPLCRCTDLVAHMPYVQMDITSVDDTRAKLEEIRPEAVIHCSAWTAVDAAEDSENREKVFALNAQGPANLAAVCEHIGSKLMMISTDYVFDGTGDVPWKPEDRCFAPLNVYGLSKLQGEQAVLDACTRSFVVRTAWVFGSNGHNFVRTMLRVGRSHDTVRVVNDQFGTPTYTKDLAELLTEMIESEKYGVYHATNEGGYLSWYDFTREIYAQAGLRTAVVPVTTAEYGLNKAERPFNSRLDKSKLSEAGFTPLPDWRDALRRYLKETGEI